MKTASKISMQNRRNTWLIYYFVKEIVTFYYREIFLETIFYLTIFYKQLLAEGAFLMIINLTSNLNS